MSWVIAVPKFLLNQIGNPRAGPQQRVVAELLGTSEQFGCQRFGRPGIQQRFAVSAAGLLQRLLAALFILLAPTADGLVGDTHFAADPAAVPPSPHQRQCPHPAGLQGVKITSDSAPVAYIGIRTRERKEIAAILRETQRESDAAKAAIRRDTGKLWQIPGSKLM